MHRSLKHRQSHFNAIMVQYDITITKKLMYLFHLCVIDAVCVRHCEGVLDLPLELAPPPLGKAGFPPCEETGNTQILR